MAGKFTTWPYAFRPIFLHIQFVSNVYSSSLMTANDCLLISAIGHAVVQTAHALEPLEYLESHGRNSGAVRQQTVDCDNDMLMGIMREIIR